jgi:hypothetical protein
MYRLWMGNSLLDSSDDPRLMYLMWKEALRSYDASDLAIVRDEGDELVVISPQQLRTNVLHPKGDPS